MFTLEQSKLFHSRNFLVPPKVQSRKAHTPPAARKQGGREGAGRRDPLDPLWKQRYSLEPTDFCKPFFPNTKHCLENFLPVQNKKETLVFWYFDRASDLHAEIMLQDGYGQKAKS